MAKELSLTEKYTLLMLYGIGRHTDFMACQFSAGIILGGLFELLQSSHISTGAGGALVPQPVSGAPDSHLTTLYANVERQPTKNMQKWLTFYCFSPTYKAIRPIIEDMVNDLNAKGYLRIIWRQGLLRKKRIIEIDRTRTAPVVDAFVRGVQSGEMSDSLVFCAEMLLLADLFKSYFPLGKRAAIKETLNQYKRSDMWKMLEPYTNAVRNFNYQNTVYTGASQ